MRILVTNDDGMNAGQLIPLIRWCQEFAEVTAVVPKYEQSGKSHSIEIHKPFEAKQVTLAPDVTVWAVDSSPADCVRFAILGLHMEFDLVLSGINRGLNIGTDIMYSGTVGAAFEAVSLGIPALAVSTPPEFYEDALTYWDSIYHYIADANLLSMNPIYNINIPKNPGKIRITRQGGPYYYDEFPAIGDNQYRPTGKCVYEDSNDESLDTDAVMHGFISITPLTTNRVNMDVYHKLASNACV